VLIELVVVRVVVIGIVVAITVRTRVASTARVLVAETSAVGELSAMRVGVGGVLLLLSPQLVSTPIPRKNAAMRQ